MFEEGFELNPMHMGIGILGGIFALVVMSQVEVSAIYKIGSFILTSILCYFIAGRILGD